MKRRWLPLLALLLSTEAFSYPGTIPYSTAPGQLTPYACGVPYSGAYIHATPQAACESIDATLRARLYLPWWCHPAFDLLVTGTHAPAVLAPNSGGSYYCRVNVFYGGQPFTVYGPNPQIIGSATPGTASTRRVCPNGGTLSGTECVCGPGETDIGTACTRNAGPCPTYPADQATGCNKTTADLYASMPTPSDLKYGFHNAQACVSKASCNARCQMDNCKWLEVLLPTHTGWYLRFEREWPAKLSECEYMRQTMNPLAEVWCTGKMGRYHIQQDLLDALVEHGCGTRSDWDLVFNAALAACPTAGNPAAQFISQGLIYDWREEARAKCLARRQAAGRPDVLIEEPLRGQTCGQ